MKPPIVVDFFALSPLLNAATALAQEIVETVTIGETIVVIAARRAHLGDPVSRSQSARGLDGELAIGLLYEAAQRIGFRLILGEEISR